MPVGVLGDAPERVPPPRRRPIRALAGAALGVAVFALAAPRLADGWWVILHHPAMSSRRDFAWMYVAMRAVWLHLDRGEPAGAMYGLAAQRLWMARQGISFSPLDLYSYPPQFAVAFAAFGALPYAIARGAWTVLDLLAFVAALGLACDLAGVRRDWRLWVGLAGVGLSCFPALTTFYWGQTDTVILFLMALGLWCIYRGDRPALGGASLALATLFKLTPGVILAYFGARWALAVLRRRRAVRRGADGADDAARLRRMRGDGRVVAGGAVGALVVTGLSVAAVGWQPMHAYIWTVLPQVQQVALAVGPAPMEQSLRGILLLFLPSTPALRVAVDLISLAVVVLLLAADERHPAADSRAVVAGLALLPLLCSPSLEGHHFVVAALAEVVLGGWLATRGSRARPALWVPYAAAVLLLAIPGTPFLPRMGLPLCGTGGGGLITAGGWLIGTGCDGQHFWSVLLLFWIAMAIVAPEWVARWPRRWPWRRDRSRALAGAG